MLRILEYGDDSVYERYLYLRRIINCEIDEEIGQ